MIKVHMLYLCALLFVIDPYYNRTNWHFLQCSRNEIIPSVCVCMFVFGYGATGWLCWSSINIAGSCYLYLLSFPPLSAFNNLSSTRSELCAQATICLPLYMPVGSSLCLCCLYNSQLLIMLAASVYVSSMDSLMAVHPLLRGSVCVQLGDGCQSLASNWHEIPGEVASLRLVPALPR